MHERLIQDSDTDNLVEERLAGNQSISNCEVWNPTEEVKELRGLPIDP